MDTEQEQEFADKLRRIGYPDFDVVPGEDDILMLHMQDKLICGALYALSMPDAELKALIDETVAAGGQG